jgi:hypothetical protein
MDEIWLYVDYPNPHPTTLADGVRRKPFVFIEHAFSETNTCVFTSKGGHLRVNIETLFPYIKSAKEALAVLQPITRHYGLKVAIKRISGRRDGHEFDVSFTPDSAWTVGHTVELKQLIYECLSFETHNPRTPNGAYLHVISGRPELMIGQAESNWLEAKGEPYRLKDNAQRYELALDLASMANTDTGGLLLVGFTTQRNSSNDDVISAVVGCDPTLIKPDQYFDAVKDKLVPRIVGLDIQCVSWGNGVLLAIRVPAQPEYLKPFMVRGGVVSENRISGSAFTIAQRTGTAKWSLSAEAVHSLISAGRLALSRTTDLVEK